MEYNLIILNGILYPEDNPQSSIQGGLTHLLLEALDSLPLLAALVSATPGHTAGTVLLRQPPQVPGVFPLHLTPLPESWDLVKVKVKVFNTLSRE